MDGTRFNQQDHMRAERAVGAPVASVDIEPTTLINAPLLAGLRLEAAAAARIVGRPGEVRVRLVDDDAMAAAHLRYSKIEGTTDVLTFDLSEGGAVRGEPLDVDILVCVDEARRQAATHGHPVEREILLYILHGIMHCLGHDDHSEEGFARMHAEEDRVLTAIGVGATFFATGSSTRQETSRG